MKPDTVLTLGDFMFSRFEIPEQISFGGAQRLVVHELVGGTRVIDALGRSDAPIEWSGMFIGQNALDRARYLDGLRIAGKPLELNYSQFVYRVVIADFRADFKAFYNIPYRINCTVLKDMAKPVTAIASAGIDDAIYGDMDAANGLGDLIGDGPLSAALGTLNTAIRAVSSFATAAQSTINSVLAPLAAVQSRVKILIASVGNTIGNVGTLGGVLPNNPISQSAAKLMGQVTAMTNAPRLYNLQSVLGRMGGNLGSIGTGAKTVTQAGGNLYGIAQQQFGDATAWTSIAKANGLVDPMLSGISTLNIPAAPDNAGGVLSA